MSACVRRGRGLCEWRGGSFIRGGGASAAGDYSPAFCRCAGCQRHGAVIAPSGLRLCGCERGRRSRRGLLTRARPLAAASPSERRRGQLPGLLHGPDVKRAVADWQWSVASALGAGKSRISSKTTYVTNYTSLRPQDFGRRLRRFRWISLRYPSLPLLANKSSARAFVAAHAFAAAHRFCVPPASPSAPHFFPPATLTPCVAPRPQALETTVRSHGKPEMGRA